MNKRFLIIIIIINLFGSFMVNANSFSYLLLNKTNIDTNEININEIRFSDSIKLINNNNESLRISREYYNSGLLLVNLDNLNDAILDFNNAILIDSMFYEAFFARAQTYHRLNNILAISDYLKSFKIDSSNFEPLYQLAEFYFNNDINLSKEVYQNIISFNSNEHKALSQLGVIYFLLNEFNKAEYYLSKSINIIETAYTLNDRASCYRGLFNYELAINDYLKAIDIDPDLAFIYNNLASVYLIIDQPKKAIQYYNLAIQKDPNYKLAYNNLASILIDEQQYDRASKNISKSLSIDSLYAPAFNNRGVIFHLKGNYNEAIFNFDKAINLENDYAKAFLNRGISKQFLRDEDGACSDWQKAKLFGIKLANKYISNDCK